ncbi:zinc finger protein 883-like [Lutzomyia longipalpis]|uniref:zinc finger protein 883-like n=1 Tax=Lutzomyia longipalpis TaxID=7200 RepID=UPI0024840E3F|nr:zinc finger protein 883-like [Lutzomyia longipalpis]
MGSLENPLVHCHIFRDLLKRIDRIHGELVDHENTLPKCEVCWENHTEFNSIKAQLLIIVQENVLINNEEAHSSLTTSESKEINPVNMVVIKEEQKTESTDDDEVHNSEVDDTDKEWNPWENNTQCINETTKKYKISCPDCLRTFCGRKRLDNHIIFCDKRKHKSEASEMKIKRLEELNNDEQHVKELYECDLCGSEFSAKSQIISHMQCHLKSSKRKTKEDSLKESENLTCHICYKKLNTTSGLKRHIKFHEKKENPGHKFTRSKQKKQYSCEFCKKSFRYVGALERHNEVRDSSKLQCETCNERFCQDTELDNHLRTAHKEKIYFQCLHCEEQFTNFRLIYKHHKVNHPNLLGPTKPFLCDTCGLAMIDSRDLKRHMMIHRGLKPHKCDVCEKTFRLKTEVEQHRRVHIPSSEITEQYACPMCPKKFRTNVTLWRHKRIHTGQVKETICHVCRRRITNPKSLEIHMLKHANEGPRLFKCEDCGRSFNKLKYLNQHRKDAHNILTDLMLNPKPSRKKKI